MKSVLSISALCAFLCVGLSAAFVSAARRVASATTAMAFGPDSFGGGAGGMSGFLFLPSRNSPQCLHLIAERSISSPQNGQSRVCFCGDASGGVDCFGFGSGSLIGLLHDGQLIC